MKIFVFLMQLLQYFNCEIVSVVALVRHGARASGSTIKDQISDFWGTNMKLTVNGFRQEMILGRYMRDKYIRDQHVLDSDYDDKSFEIISSPTQRTIYSAVGLIDGLFPGNIVDVEYDDKNLGYISNDTIPIEGYNMTKLKEIPLRVVDRSVDYLFHSHGCKYEGMIVNMKSNTTKIFELSDEEVSEAIDEIKRVGNVLPEKSNLMKQKDNLKDYLSFFMSHIYHHGQSSNFGGIKEAAVRTVKKAQLNGWYNSRVKDNKYLRLGSSEFFDLMIKKFDKIKQNEKEVKKVTIFTGHDTNLVDAVTNLRDFDYLNEIVKKAVEDKNLFLELVPPFCSSLIFELHKEKDNFYVKINYNGKPITKGLKKNFIKEDNILDGKIPFDEFHKLVEYLVEKDYDKLECSKEQTNDKVFLKK